MRTARAPSSQVPNAPRGCIGEIFGGEGSANGNGKGNGNGSQDTPSRPRDTHSRLFGPVNRPPTAVRDTLKSNISFGEESARLSSTNGHSNGHANGHSNGHVNGQSNGHSVAPKEGNPLSGEGYKSMNGEINTVTALNGNGSSPINHNRVPPGGFSSGLW
ncbi:microtubule-associated protein Jupiter-like isoform X2 [Arctopsyche grandis]|uniref:microtubule-associated protein Jupiter-like isoform X2 n=1 Tax=Arctopsyche grandis TaxID=121162 RepID=UPI00406D69B5